MRLPSISRLTGWLGSKNRPKNLFNATNIETYAYCNRKCDFCFNGERFKPRAKGIMAEAMWRKIVDELGQVHFTGRISPHFYGEPLMDKRLPELIAYAKSQCPRATLRINSNGDLLTAPLLKALIASGLDRLFITNYDEEPNAGLKDMARDYPKVIVYREYETVRMANRAGAMFPVDNDATNLPCFRPAERLVINWQGNVVLCCNDYYEEHVMGNVADKSILDIWRSDRFESYRRTLRQPGGRHRLDFCRNCDM
jgi:radical SAM protein with 4Fe4S-binding SPASM domain